MFTTAARTRRSVRTVSERLLQLGEVPRRGTAHTGHRGAIVVPLLLRGG